LHFYIFELACHIRVMKLSILLTALLTLTIVLSVTSTLTSAKIAFAIENYLQLRSANVNQHGGDIDVDIRTGGNIPSENGNNGFGYAVLTDVGDESVDNVLVAISDIGIKNSDKSTTNDKLYTYVLDLTGDTSSACSGSDYEVTKSSSDNEGFDTNYPIDVKGNEISIDDIDTNDLASGTVKAIASFTAEAINHDGKINQICIDIQDILKQSEINVGYDSDDNNDDDNNNDDNGNKNKDDDNNNNKDDTRKHNPGQDDCDIGDKRFPFCDGRPGDKDSNDDEDDCDIDDPGFPFCDGRDEDEEEEEDSNNSPGVDIDQDIDQSNECSGSSTCSNQGSNEANVGGTDSSSSSSDNDGFELDIGQSIEQGNTCSDEADCSNEGSNEANIWEDIGSQADIGQSIKQSNECVGEASCNNEGSNEANVLGHSTSNEEDLGSGTEIDQSIEQSNTCSGGAKCSNSASNVANVG
jgi:hypothetical protein